MKSLIALVGALLTATGVLADPYSSAIQQAKRVSAQETAANQRLMDNPPPAAPPQNNANPQANAMLQATMQNIESLRNDFTAIANAATNASLTVLKQSLTNDLAIAALGTKPKSESISKLADDLTTAIAGKEKLRAAQPKLAQFVHAIFNGAQLTAVQQKTMFDGVRKILTDGGASPEQTANVVSDIKTIASETK
jgi:hypothetical protein